MLAGLRDVDKFYGGQDVLRGVNLNIEPGDRLALVGRNGAGKTTVLRLLSRLEEPNGGKVILSPGVQVGLLEQDPTFQPDATIIETVESAFTELDALEARLRELEALLAGHPGEELLHDYHDLEEHYRLRGGYARNSRRDSVISALGFTGRETQPAKGLSGGERTRLALARLLVAQPEILLLDEPTNHLDMVMVEWLEGFLRGYPGAILVVSHDRAFLDNLCETTVLATVATLRVYPGNYSAYRAAREAELSIQTATFENQKKELERLEAMTSQMKIWGGRNEKLANRARAMEKRLERFEEGMTDAPPPPEVAARVRFVAPESGEIVLLAGHMTRRFGSRTLFKDVDVTVRRGERIALIGRNGTGKTTLVKTLLGLEPSDDPRGFTRLGSRVRLGYYDQQLRGVDPERTLFQEVLALVETDQEARDLLGAFLFPYEAQFKEVRNLSGGERARLALLKLSLEEHNLLVLDEPTNHLDVEMLESLEAAIRAYTGTLILVSHDRRFVQNTANQIWTIEDNRFTTYPGGYAYYREKHGQDDARMLNEAATAARAERPQEAPRKVKGNPWALRKQVGELEGRISALEAEKETLAGRLANPSADTDFAALGKRASEIEMELEDTLRRWEETATQLEEAEA
ncbi:MAG TPA: ABC-F family ATP-binding cassette domain-containing protein [Deinococcales bacterium]|nr:ABC-F family ATP-binding cassette domain-containing protein [Deinococcales bacterium]